MTCNMCDVINIVWRKILMAQKTDREDIVLEHYQPLLFQIFIL